VFLTIGVAYLSLNDSNFCLCEPEQRRAAADGKLGHCQQKPGEPIAARASKPLPRVQKQLYIVTYTWTRDS
jgi:hypothetical protein